MLGHLRQGHTSDDHVTLDTELHNVYYQLRQVYVSVLTANTHEITENKRPLRVVTRVI